MKNDNHDCKEYADTKWRFHPTNGWEIVFDYCAKCGKIIKEHTAVNEFD